MALGDLAEVRVNIVGPATWSQCGLGMQCITIDPLWRLALAEEFFTQIIPDWMGCLGFNVVCRTVDVVDVVPGTGATAVYTPVVEPHGALIGQAAPANCAYVISWRSDGIGRNTRGRNYLYGLPRVFAAESNHWEDDAPILVQNLVEVILAQYGPTGFSDLARLQIISRGPKSAPLTVPQSFPVTHAFFSSEIRSMRKRLPL